MVSKPRNIPRHCDRVNPTKRSLSKGLPAFFRSEHHPTPALPSSQTEPHMRQAGGAVRDRKAHILPVLAHAHFPARPRKSSILFRVQAGRPLLQHYILLEKRLL